MSTAAPPESDPSVREEFSEALPHTAAARGGRRIDRAQFAPLVQELSKVGWVRSLLPVLLEWAAIVGLVAGAVHLGTWWGYLIAGVLMAGRQMGLSVLMHDGVHCRLSPSRRVNEWVGDLLCALPVGMSMARFRKTHLTHHRHLSTDQDPDFTSMAANPQFRFPMQRGRFVRLMARDFFGLNALNSLRYMNVYRPFGPGLGWRSWILNRGQATNAELNSADRIRALLMVPLVAALFLALPAHVRLPAALLWVIPYCTVYVFLLRFRSISDHLCVPNRHELDATRHVDQRWWEKIFLPWNINVHIAHHIFPSVPQYLLPKLHRRMMEVPEIREQAHVTRGYGFGGVIGELTYSANAKDRSAAPGPPQV